MQFLRAHYPMLLLVSISLILCIANYRSGTFLSGWDTLHPEFNFPLALRRALFGVFRPEQGLGAPAAHSHMADLPHILILYILDFLLPMSFLRYAYIFLCLIAGPLGMYLFLQKHLLHKKLPSLLGALFYLLNLGTVQTFNVPFEMFTTLYATLPFVFLFASSFIIESEHRRRNLFLFSLAIFFTAPAAYAATLWYIFFLAFVSYFLIFALVLKSGIKERFRSISILIGVVLAINAFWILPNISYITTHGKEVSQTNINKLFSEEAFLKNKEVGTFPEILLLKTFYFDWAIYSGGEEFSDLLSPFIQHLKNPLIISVGYIFSGLALLGLIYSFRAKRAISLSLAPVLAISLFFLVNHNPPTGFLFAFLQQTFPLFQEAFRFPGDKILNIYLFIFSIFFAFSQLFLIEKLRMLGRQKLQYASAVFVTALLLYYLWPAFSGNLIHPRMRIQIPKEYFDLFSYMNQQEEKGRVANLPIHSLWGWVYHDWWSKKASSFQGSGFLSFGIPQPLLERDFDRWEITNEGYFREMSYAIYAKDSNLVRDVIRKYQIAFLLLDTSVVAPGVPPRSLFFEETKQLLNTLVDNGVINAPSKIGPHVSVYHVKNLKSYPLRTLSQAVNASARPHVLYRDVLYQTYGDYIAKDQENDTPLSFPFTHLIDNQSKVDKNRMRIDDHAVHMNPISPFQSLATLDPHLVPPLVPVDIVASKTNQILSLSFSPQMPLFDDSPTALPLHATVPLSSQHIRYLAVNNHVFPLANLPSSTPVYLGNSFLSNSSITISLFANPSSVPLPLLSLTDPAFSFCDDETTQTDLQILLQNQTIRVINPTRKSVCITLPLSFLKNLVGPASARILSEISFSYQGPSDISACIKKQEEGSCSSLAHVQENGSQKLIIFTIPTEELSSSLLSIRFDPQRTQQDEVLFNPSILTSLPTVQGDLDSSSFTQMILPPASSSFSTLTLPKHALSSLDVTGIERLHNDCPFKGNSARKEIREIKGKHVIRYTSVAEGSFCDHFSYEHLPHALSYLVMVESKNISGLPLSFCITNYTSRHCDLYARLGKWKEFSHDVFLLPSTDEGGMGYDINLENTGINRTPGINEIASITFIPFPYELLQSLYATPLPPVSHIYEGGIKSVEEYVPNFFMAEVESTKPTLIALSHSSLPGFKAYHISCKSVLSCGTKALLAPLLGREIQEKVTVNNWEGGWLIANIPGQEGKIVMLYLPQYLEYIGFLILLWLTGFTVLVLRRKQKPHLPFSKI